MKHTTTLLFLLVSLTVAQSQDSHFSMFYNAPLSLNPALTGLMVEDIRAVAQYRNQWQSVTVPYQTTMISADANILKGTLQDDFVGVGLMIFNDRAGDGELQNTQIMFSGSYNKDLSGSGNHYLSGGFQIGFGQQLINFRKLLFDSQYDGEGLDRNIPSGENLVRDNFFYADMAAGLAWNYAPSQKESYYAGVAVSHFNEPNRSFLGGEENTLFRKWTYHAGFEVPVTSGLSFVPRVIGIIQGPYSEINLGALLKFRVNPELGEDYGQTAFYLGTMRRFGDAQVVIFKFDIERFTIGAAYDINISKLDLASQNNGGFELGITYRTWLYSAPANTGPIGCPTF